MALSYEGYINVTDQDVFVPEVWSKDMIIARESYLTAAKLVKRYDEEVSNFGDLIHIPEVSPLVAKAVGTPGSDVQVQSVEEGEKTIAIDKYYEASFYIHDKFSAQTKYRYAKEMADQAGQALAKQMDSDILALYSSAGSFVGDGATEITKTTLLDSIAKLDGADVPSNDRHLIVDELGKKQLFKEVDFIRYDATGQASPALTGARQGGEFGSIYGVKVHVSTNVPVETATPNVVHGMMFHRDAIGLAVQKNNKTETQRELKKLATLVVATVLYGVAVLRADHLVDVRYKQA
jgi:N4-gp56 family major capsid protein